MRIVLVGWLVGFVTVVCAEDWPQWLGPTRDGVWRETGIMRTFPEDGPPLRWRTAIAGGYSGPAVASGHVIVHDWVAAPSDDPPAYLHDGPVPKNTNFVRQRRPGHERVICLRQSDGQIEWTHRYPCDYTTVGTYAIGPRATPTIDGDRVYSVGAEGDLICMRLDDGKPLWQVNYPRRYDVSVPNWGFSSPPLVDGDRLICIVGGDGTTCVALNKFTGQEIWRSLSATEPGYSAPVIRTVAGHRQLIVWDSDAVHGLDPETGEVFWNVAFPSTYAMSVATPQVLGDRIFVMCFNGKSALIKVAAEGRSAKIQWQGDRKTGIDGVHNTASLVDEFIYGCGNGGRYICARMSDGERVWSTFQPIGSNRPVSWGNVFTIRNEDRFFLANDQGELIIANLSPKGYVERSRAQLIEPTHQVGRRKLVWSHPAFADRCVFLRNDQEVRCYDLGEKR